MTWLSKVACLVFGHEVPLHPDIPLHVCNCCGRERS